MKLPQDFREFLELFNAKGVEYMIVGSYALAYYGVPRYTLSPSPGTPTGDQLDAV